MKKLWILMLLLAAPAHADIRWFVEPVTYYEYILAFNVARELMLADSALDEKEVECALDHAVQAMDRAQSKGTIISRQDVFDRILIARRYASIEFACELTSVEE